MLTEPGLMLVARRYQTFMVHSFNCCIISMSTMLPNAVMSACCSVIDRTSVCSHCTHSQQLFHPGTLYLNPHPLRHLSDDHDLSCCIHCFGLFRCWQHLDYGLFSFFLCPYHSHGWIVVAGASRENSSSSMLAVQRGFGTYMIGFVYGLHPDALFVVLPALALPTRMGAFMYISMFVVGTVTAMGGYSLMIGKRWWLMPYSMCFLCPKLVATCDFCLLSTPGRLLRTTFIFVHIGIHEHRSCKQHSRGQRLGQPFFASLQARRDSKLLRT